jgi:hypothetical protein
MKISDQNVSDNERLPPLRISQSENFLGGRAMFQTAGFVLLALWLVGVTDPYAFGRFTYILLFVAGVTGLVMYIRNQISVSRNFSESRSLRVPPFAAKRTT